MWDILGNGGAPLCPCGTSPPREAGGEDQAGVALISVSIL